MQLDALAARMRSLVHLQAPVCRTDGRTSASACAYSLAAKAPRLVPTRIAR